MITVFNCSQDADTNVKKSVVATPTFSPVAGSYSSSQNVTIDCSTDKVTIYYTTDGTEPTDKSTKYLSGINVSSSMTIKAKAYKSGMNPSLIATEVYEIYANEVEALNGAKTTASLKVQSDYTAESWTSLTQALALPESTKSEVEAKTTAINNAIAGLVFSGLSALDTAKNTADAKVQSEYTTDSWSAFQSALTTALALPESSQSEVVAKTTAINNAISLLVRLYSISYTLNGGTATNPTSYTVETEDFTLNNPEKTGYTFTGWSGTDLTGTDNTVVTITKGSTGNRSFTANWNAISYTISYTLNGGTASNPTSYTVETDTFTLTNPTKPGFVFVGWSGTDLTGTDNTVVTITQGSTGNRSFTANWDWALYNLRDTGPAGGLIFYINPNAFTDGWKYLEAAPQSTEWTSKQWGKYGTLVGGTGTAIGTGKNNTALIVAKLNEATADSDRAAQLCDALTHNGYDDWFLPSRDELYEMCWVLHSRKFINIDNPAYGTNRVGGFADDYYWSSSENGSEGACDQLFSNGEQFISLKGYDDRVRAVRAF